MGVLWERSCAEIAQNGTKPPKLAETRPVQSPEQPEQLWFVPDSEQYLKRALVLRTSTRPKINLLLLLLCLYEGY
jgi:hypothetical protein